MNLDLMLNSPSISKQAQGDLRGESLSLLEKTQTHCKTHNAYKQVQYLSSGGVTADFDKGHGVWASRPVRIISL